MNLSVRGSNNAFERTAQASVRRAASALRYCAPAARTVR